MSQITIPGVDIEERSGSIRVRVRMYPFFALSETFADDLSASIWGCQQLQRLQGLHAQLQREGRLPTKQLTRATAGELGLHDLIEPPTTMAHSDNASKSMGDEIQVYEVLDSYIANEATRLSAGYKSRATRLKDYFGNVPISTITTSALETYIVDPANFIFQKAPCAA